MIRRLTVLLFIVCLTPAVVLADGKPAGDFQPDPRGVQRYGPAYRYWQEGWIVLHIEGKPYERGVQHGRLLAPEIAAHVRCFATTQNPKSPTEGWKQTRTLTNALFLRRYDQEYLEEMKGIADGANAAGAKFDGRALDLIDIVALNAWPEIDTLDSALDATPTGLEGLRFPQNGPKATPAPKPMRCSAFAANGKATRDGKIVFGHITMFSLYPSSFYNVWIDAKCSEGQRVLMQSYPGGMQSGLDYYMNDAGLLISETTLSQTRFDIKGMALASRIRKAIQYADTIDKAVEILRDGNNGLYTNEWLLADIKTNEIAMFELGTHQDRLYRSSKNDWYGGTEGFYWGCNNTKDLDVRLETISSVKDRPAAAVFRPSDRDKMWLKLYDQHYGKIDAEFGKLAFTTPPLAAYPSLDAKFTTTDMAKDLKTFALFGPPLGRTWQPTFEERQKYPEIQPMVGNPWTILHAVAPENTKLAGAAAVDLHNPERGGNKLKEPASDPQMEPAWHGTLLPKTDSDVWLAVGFAQYERYVALEKALRKHSNGKLTPADQDRLRLALFAPYTTYCSGARVEEERPLAETKADVRKDAWYNVASGKGALLLHDLRQLLGPDPFDALMEEYGKEHAGKEVTTADFRAFVEKKAGKSLAEFFESWLRKTGLPNLKSAAQASGPFSVLTFNNELEQTLIVYGTGNEANTNWEAAEALQRAVIARHSNYTVPIKSDREATEDDLKKNHLLLIGRPDCNSVTAKVAGTLPIKFGLQSFAVRDDVYAHQGSAVIVAAENPSNKRFSLVVLAGLNGSSTLRAATRFMDQHQAAEVVVYPNGKKPSPLVIQTSGMKTTSEE
jgi:Phospholipase B/Peptidase family M1 domain